MPHREGHSLVPEFSFPRSWEMASQAIPGFMSPEQYRQIGRGLLDYVPGVGTALNWGEMGPWGRAGSVGLDALDLLTAGGGKPGTAALRGLMNLAKHNPLDPKMISVRGGLPRVDEAGNYLPSINAITGQPEAGVSVYQGAQFPFGRGTVLRNAPWQNIEYPLTPGSVAHRLMPGGKYTINPLAGQEQVLKTRFNDMYRILGDVMPWAQGSDLEALVNPETISGVTHMPFSKFQRLPFNFADWKSKMSPENVMNWVPGLGSSTELPIVNYGMGKRALDLFAKHNPQGTPLPITPNAIDQWLARARLASTIPATVPARGVNYTWDTPGIFGGASPTNRGNLSPGG